MPTEKIKSKRKSRAANSDVASVVSDDAEKITVQLPRELLVSNGVAVREILLSALAAEQPVDLSTTEYVDTAGAQLLLAYAQQLPGRHLRACKPSAALITGLAKVGMHSITEEARS